MARERPDSINFNLKDALMRRLQACGHKWRFHLRLAYGTELREAFQRLGYTSDNGAA